jgi:hypothetical protein
MERSPSRGANAVGHHQHSFQKDPAGSTLLGCLSGLIIGFVGGLLLLILAAVVAAATATMPPIEPNTDLAPDLHLIIAEGFLNRYAEQPPAGSVAIDIIPRNEIRLDVKTNVELSGGTAPVQIIGQFELLATPQGLAVQLIDTRVVDSPLPLDLSDYFGPDLRLINQQLDLLVGEIARGLGNPILVTDLSTTDSQIRLEIKEVR